MATLLIALPPILTFNAGLWVAIAWPEHEKLAPIDLLIQIALTALWSPLFTVWKLLEWLLGRKP